MDFREARRTSGTSHDPRKNARQTPTGEAAYACNEQRNAGTGHDEGLDAKPLLDHLRKLMIRKPGLFAPCMIEPERCPSLAVDPEGYLLEEEEEGGKRPFDARVKTVRIPPESWIQKFEELDEAELQAQEDEHRRICEMPIETEEEAEAERRRWQLGAIREEEDITSDEWIVPPGSGPRKPVNVISPYQPPPWYGPRRNSRRHRHRRQPYHGRNWNR